jgi:hypothetical protein
VIDGKSVSAIRAAVLAVVVCLIAAPVSAQTGGTQLDPQRLQQPLRSPITLTPTITVTEEFNDNVLLDNRDRRWDLITGFTPGLVFNWEAPTYRLAAGYSFTAEIFARDPGANHAFDRQAFTLDSFYKVDPTLTLSLSDGFTYDLNTNLIAREAIATGRNRAWGNTLSPGVEWRFSDLWTARATASYTMQRFSRDDLEDSDVYRVETALLRRITPRLSGSIGYEFDFFDIRGEETSTVHTPRLGFVYQITETISLSVNGGPSYEIRERSGDRITPAVRANLTQRTFFGSWGLSFDRSIGTAGGLGGTTDNTTIGGLVQLSTLMKGLVVSFAPNYSIVKSPGDRRDERGRIDETSFTVPLQATYRLTPWLALVGAYQFFEQRSDSTIRDRNGEPLAVDADQNRVWVGVQFGYPIRFD